MRPRAVLEWQKRRFRDHWRRKSEGGGPGRRRIDPGLRELIRRISRANPTWGSPRIVGELGKVGIVVAKSTVEKYRIRTIGSPSPTWKAFLENHVKELVSTDFFVVPTVRWARRYCSDRAGYQIVCTCQVGDGILFGQHSRTEVKLPGEELLVIREDDVMARIAH